MPPSGVSKANEKGGEMYKIQFEEWFMWIDHILIPPDPNSVPYYLQQVKQSHPTRRVRCVDEEGRVIDMIS